MHIFWLKNIGGRGGRKRPLGRPNTETDAEIIFFSPTDTKGISFSALAILEVNFQKKNITQNLTLNLN
jgi:hypothetical protein